MGKLARDEVFLHVLLTSDLHTENVKTMFGSKIYKGKPINDYSVAELNILRKDDINLDAFRVSSKSVK